MPLPRRELALLILHHLERAPLGLTKHDLLAAIGPTNTSLPSIQRALDQLRSDDDANLHYDPQTHRWHLTTPLPLPLEAPAPGDVVAALTAQALAESLGDGDLADRLMKMAEDLDARARTRSSPTDLPPRKAISCALTLGTRIDAAIFTTILFACRRKQLQIQYASPWTPPVDPIPTQIIEPWALRIMAGGIYLRAWSHKSQHAKTYRLAHVESVEIDPALPTEIPPTDLWDDAHPAFGIDDDRPDVAVIRLRGGVARHAAKSIWHPSERDRWIGDGHELLERTIAYRSCREFAAHILPYSKGIVSISPRPLFDEFQACLAVGPSIRCGDDLRD